MTYHSVLHLPDKELMMSNQHSGGSLYQVGGQLPPIIRGDQIRLKQVLVNLIKNALKFSFGKPVNILACYNRHKELLEVHIQDHGYGISPDDQEKLFKLFGTLDATRDANASGIGIGLNICKKIV